VAALQLVVDRVAAGVEALVGQPLARSDDTSSGATATCLNDERGRFDCAP